MTRENWLSLLKWVRLVLLAFTAVSWFWVRYIWLVMGPVLVILGFVIEQLMEGDKQETAARESQS